MQQWFIERNGAKIKLSATREIWKYKNTQASRWVIQKFDKLALSYSKTGLIIIAQNWIHSSLINIEELLGATLRSRRAQEWIYRISNSKSCELKIFFLISSETVGSRKCFLGGFTHSGEVDTTLRDKRRKQDKGTWEKVVTSFTSNWQLPNLTSWPVSLSLDLRWAHHQLNTDLCRSTSFSPFLDNARKWRWRHWKIKQWLACPYEQVPRNWDGAISTVHLNCLLFPPFWWAWSFHFLATKPYLFPELWRM